MPIMGRGSSFSYRTLSVLESPLLELTGASRWRLEWMQLEFVNQIALITSASSAAVFLEGCHGQLISSGPIVNTYRTGIGGMRFVCPKSLVVLVTGGTAGIGEATARRFCGSGSRVIVTGRRENRLEALKREIGDRLHTVHCDVTDTPGMERALSSLPDGFGEISVLVNNAGAAFGLHGADEGNLDEWNKMVDINIKGLLATTHLVLPGMVERRKGHVINLGSTAGTYPYPGGNVYGATKAFVKMFSLNLRADLLGKNLRVTNVEPGMCSTEFSVVRFGGDVERANNVYKGMQPMTADDIAEMVYWCATLPEHVNINRIECMPTSQAFNAFAVARDS